MHLPLFVFFIQISLLASLTIYFQNKAELYLKFFPPFLMLTGLVEILAIYLVDHNKPSIILYNVFSICELSFYFFVLGRIIKNKIARKIIFYAWLVYLAIAFYNLFMGDRNTFNSMPYSGGCLLIVAICIYYFFELYQQPGSVNLLRQSAFWICTGLLIFYACTFPIFGMANFMKKAPYVIRGNLLNIVNFLNVFLYSFFTIAFLCRIRTWKYIS